ncbi:hypothetical protein BCR44DRAFT_51919 [Catenaria anguillulae PL171]|uniref:Uncharacterized protein n=1 Tax=Catenaria anguillulae PL171 TaxID=765915 RepID=A0A1Y2I6F6_9FUNG|nr:hypothetical protein BCR44DRAFT_51919 [Catenaria anguillulae PL171]
MLESFKHCLSSCSVTLVLAKQLHAFVPKAGLVGLPFRQRLQGLQQLPLASISPADAAKGWTLALDVSVGEFA